MKIIPLNEFRYVEYPITQKDFYENFANEIDNKTNCNSLINKIITVDNKTLQCIGITKKIDAENGVIVDMTVSEIAEKNREIQIAQECKFKENRAHWMDVYRKYQAAVNYGEIERNKSIETFIQSLRNKDWRVLNDIPDALKYFDGKTGIKESGLITKI